MKAKKIMALLLASVMTFSLMACGGGSTPSSSDSTVEDDADDDDDDDDVDEADAADGEEDAEDYEDLLAEVIPEETVTLDVLDQE